MKIPLMDLSFQHREIRGEVREGFERLMEAGEFVLGPTVAEFENEYAGFCGVEHCIGVANGTDALELGLRAVEIGAGDEVILPVGHSRRCRADRPSDPCADGRGPLW